MVLIIVLWYFINPGIARKPKLCWRFRVSREKKQNVPPRMKIWNLIEFDSFSRLFDYDSVIDDSEYMRR